MDADAQIAFHGRIVALDLVIRALLTQSVMEAPGDPLERLDQSQQAMKQSLQHIDRPIGDYEDAVWAEASDALDLLFANVRMRVEDMAG